MHVVFKLADWILTFVSKKEVKIDLRNGLVLALVLYWTERTGMVVAQPQSVTTSSFTKWVLEQVIYRCKHLFETRSTSFLNLKASNDRH